MPVRDRAPLQEQTRMRHGRLTVIVIGCVAALAAGHAASDGHQQVAHAAALSADCTRAVQIDDGSSRWTIGPSLQTLRNGVHVGDGRGTVYLWTNRVLYVLGTDSRWYRWTGTAWAAHGGTQPACGTAALKFAYWNVQYGTGVTSAGVPCSAGDDRDYGTQRARNAWGNGHLQSYLTQYVRDDPSVVAFGASEINPGFAMRPSAVLAHLGWQAKTEIGDEALFARHGFAALDSKRLTQCGSIPRYALYGRVWTDSTKSDWVHVVSTHLMHPHTGDCSSGIQIREIVEWIAQKTADGRPVILMGDLNLVVEKSESTSYFPDHIRPLTDSGYVDTWRAVYPNVTTHPGATATWHSTGHNPLPNGDINDWGLWKRIDYVFAKGAAVTGAQLFNDHIGDPRNCAASDHAGIVATIGVSRASAPSAPSPGSSPPPGVQPALSGPQGVASLPRSRRNRSHGSSPKGSAVPRNGWWAGDLVGIEDQGGTARQQLSTAQNSASADNTLIDAAGLAGSDTPPDRTSRAVARTEWLSDDVGQTGRPGAAVFSGSNVAITGSGAGIVGNADALHLTYRAVAGDFDLMARMTGADALAALASAGLSIRAGRRSDSAHVSLLVTRTAGEALAFSRRTLAGGMAAGSSGPHVAPAVWLRLSRRGHTVAAAYREAGTADWMPLGQEFLPELPDVVLAGVAVSSGRTGAAVTVSFEHVEVVPAP